MVHTEALAARHHVDVLSEAAAADKMPLITFEALRNRTLIIETDRTLALLLDALQVSEVALNCGLFDVHAMLSELSIQRFAKIQRAELLLEVGELAHGHHECRPALLSRCNAALDELLDAIRSFLGPFTTALVALEDIDVILAIVDDVRILRDQQASEDFDENTTERIGLRLKTIIELHSQISIKKRNSHRLSVFSRADIAGAHVSRSADGATSTGRHRESPLARVLVLIDQHCDATIDQLCSIS